MLNSGVEEEGPNQAEGGLSPVGAGVVMAGEGSKIGAASAFEAEEGEACRDEEVVVASWGEGDACLVVEAWEDEEVHETILRKRSEAAVLAIEELQEEQTWAAGEPQERGSEHGAAGPVVPVEIRREGPERVLVEEPSALELEAGR